MPLYSLILWALLVQTPAESSPFTASIIDDEIWLITASGSRLTAQQLTHDGVPKRLATLSPSGKTVAYVINRPVANDAPKEEIDLVDLNGDIRQRIIPEGYVPREFDRLDWLDEQRIGALACGHANCMYWVLNRGSGKTIQVMAGGFDFIWSHNRLFVARLRASYSCEGIHEGYGCPEHDAVLLNRDEVYLYPPENTGKNFDDSHSHDIGLGTYPLFVWSPDDKWVAFTDLIGPEDGWYVVILSPSGKMLRDTVPTDPDLGATLDWTDDAHLELHTGTRVFQFAIKGNDFSEVRQTR